MSDSASTGTRIALILGSIAIIAVLAWLLVTSQGGSVMAAAGLALLLGGATGNVTDRILQGAVTDFFEVWFGAYRYPAFNVADSAITIGVGKISPEAQRVAEEREIFFERHLVGGDRDLQLSISELLREVAQLVSVGTDVDAGDSDAALLAGRV